MSGPGRRTHGAGALSVASVLAIVVSACGSGSGPLVADVAQRGFISCVSAPNPSDRTISRWNSPIGFALDKFVNVSRSPLTVESVSMIDPHDLVLHGALVYEMPHSMHPLIQETGWNKIGSSVPQALWSRHQAIPGAVIPAGYPTSNFLPSYKLNYYELVVDLTASSPNGGWALGEEITYRADGQTYAVKAYTGYAISRPTNAPTFCDAQTNAIKSAFNDGS